MCGVWCMVYGVWCMVYGVWVGVSVRMFEVLVRNRENQRLEVAVRNRKNQCRSPGLRTPHGSHLDEHS